LQKPFHPYFTIIGLTMVFHRHNFSLAKAIFSAHP
jgi:hypothetical protein